MTDPDFVCYTSENEYESLVEFFYTNEKISEERLKLKVFNLDENNSKELIKKWKNYDHVKTSDRCFEIQ
jgi:hypothetical protein